VSEQAPSDTHQSQYRAADRAPGFGVESFDEAIGQQDRAEDVERRARHAQNLIVGHISLPITAVKRRRSTASISASACLILPSAPSAGGVGSWSANPQSTCASPYLTLPSLIPKATPSRRAVSG